MSLIGAFGKAGFTSAEAQSALAGLPSTFDAWKAAGPAKKLPLPEAAFAAESLANLRWGGTGANQYKRKSAEVSKEISASAPPYLTCQQAAGGAA